MIARVSGCGLAVLACCAAAFAQGAEGPEFEVASVKPSEPMTGGRFMMGMRGGPGTPGDPGQITATNMALRDLMTTAYNVKRYQISGPDWIDTARFDIVAKVPAGATKEQVQVMWQNLLKERFALKLHRETKEMPMYALVAAKGGPKVKESVVDPTAPTSQPGSPGGPSPDGPPPAMGIPKIGKDGMPEMPAGMRRPGSMMMMMMNGRMRLMGTGVTITSLTENLGRQFDRPITDQTGLTKTYDITLDFAPEPGGMMKGMPAPAPGAMMAPPPGGAGGEIGGGGGGGGMMMHGPEGAAGEVPTLAVALQEQLGLKLEAKKGPVEILVIDHMEKTATEN